MKVKDIVLLAAKILGLQEGISAYFDGSSTEMEHQAEQLLACFHVAESSLAMDYLPLRAEDEVYSTTGRVEFSKLTYSPVRILEVTDTRGNPQAYTLYSTYLKTSAGVVLISYTYTPNLKTAEEECDFDLSVASSVLVYGLLAEYCLGEGLTEEAAAWDKKRKDSMESIYHTAKCKRLSSRRWV